MNLFSGLKGESMNKVQSDLEKFAEEFNQLCEKYNVYVTENGLCKMYAGKKDSQDVIYLKGDHVG